MGVAALPGLKPALLNNARRQHWFWNSSIVLSNNWDDLAHGITGEMRLFALCTQRNTRYELHALLLAGHSGAR